MFLRIGDLGLLFSATQAAQIDLSAAPSPPPPPPPPPPPTDDITVVLSASRLSGPAPLAAHFMAIGTTADIDGVTDTFRQLLYTFDFGDEDAGTWAISGKSKNEHIGGPVTAHVFETPGTYTVRCTATRGESSNYEEVTITVEDPDTVYAGTNTIFVSPSGNYAGAPSGATTATSIPTIVSNRRYMLRPGESFGSVSIPHGVSGTQVVAAPLSGAKPIVSSVQVGTGGQAPNANFPEDITIANLEMSGGLTQTASCRRLLLLNLDQPNNHGWMINSAIEYWADPSRYGPTMPMPREYFVIGCTSDGNRDGSSPGFYGFLPRSAVMGCSFKNTWQHIMRLWASTQSIIAHNVLGGGSSDGVRHSLKMHSTGSGTFPVEGDFSTSGWATRHNVVMDNVFSDEADNNQYAVVIGPQNGIVSEAVEDVIFENNRFKRGPNYVTDGGLSGRRMTAINNTQFSGGGAAAVEQPGLHNEGLPDGWEGPYYTSRT